MSGPAGKERLPGQAHHRRAARGVVQIQPPPPNLYHAGLSAWGFERSCPRRIYTCSYHLCRSWSISTCYQERRLPRSRNNIHLPECQYPATQVEELDRGVSSSQHVSTSWCHRLSAMLGSATGHAGLVLPPSGRTADIPRLLTICKKYEALLSWCPKWPGWPSAKQGNDLSRKYWIQGYGRWDSIFY